MSLHTPSGRMYRPGACVGSVHAGCHVDPFEFMQIALSRARVSGHRRLHPLRTSCVPPPRMSHTLLSLERRSGMRRRIMASSLATVLTPRCSTCSWSMKQSSRLLAQALVSLVRGATLPSSCSAMECVLLHWLTFSMTDWCVRLLRLKAASAQRCKTQFTTITLSLTLRGGWKCTAAEFDQQKPRDASREMK